MRIYEKCGYLIFREEREKKGYFISFLVLC